MNTLFFFSSSFLLCGICKMVNLCMCTFIQNVIALDKKKPFEMGVNCVYCMWMECYTKSTSSKAIHIQLLKPVDIVPFRRKSVYSGAFHIHFRQVDREGNGMGKRKCCCCCFRIFHINIEM